MVVPLCGVGSGWFSLILVDNDFLELVCGELELVVVGFGQLSLLVDYCFSCLVLVCCA